LRHHRNTLRCIEKKFHGYSGNKIGIDFFLESSTREYSSTRGSPNDDAMLGPSSKSRRPLNELMVEVGSKHQWLFVKRNVS